MGAIGRLCSLVWHAVPRPRDHRPVLVRRAAIDCPGGHGPAEVDLLMGPGATPLRVLRCSCRPEHPPACDQACRVRGDTVARPPQALLILPPGTLDVPDEQD
jgi:hypothetical protein